jgi:membrane-bound lytic murein transglycosylase D
MKPLLPAILLTIILTLPSARGHAQENAADSARYARLCAMLQPYNIPFNTALGDSIRYRLHHEKREKSLHTLYLDIKPDIMAAFRDCGLPDCFQYLPLALSRMSVQSESAHDRAGIWMISRLTAIQYGLRCDSLVDERFDPQKASAVAVAELQRLLKLYEGNIWECLLAYCASPAAVNAEKIRLGMDNPSPWQLQESKRLGMENHLASMLSWFYVMHGQEVPPGSTLHGILTEKPIIRSQMLEYLNWPESQFVRQNPTLKGWHMPAGTRICLSPEMLARWTTAQDTIYLMYEQHRTADSLAKVRADSLLHVQDSLQQAKAAKESSTIIHTVKSGETLGGIAAKYHVSVADIKRWNGLKGDLIQIGQKLKIER